MVYTELMESTTIFRDFAKNLHELILSEGITVNEFARRVGIPQPTVSRYPNCKREITVSNLVKIAAYFGEDIDFLLGRKQY